MRLPPFVFLVAVMLIGLVGCSSHEFANADERNINIATRAVEIADDFLDAHISDREARNRIEALASIEHGGITDDAANFSLNITVRSLKLAIRFPSQDATEHWDTVLERRNSLAQGLGMRRR